MFSAAYPKHNYLAIMYIHLKINNRLLIRQMNHVFDEKVSHIFGGDKQTTPTTENSPHESEIDA